jgi:D-arabinose 1-dehydrogenase-like Zn-dependent alcohol dehydrogenase
LHDVRAAVEVLPMDQANLALDKVRRNQARYRMVLENLETEV